MDVKYFKIKYGFGESDYCSITDQELPKAYGMFLSQEGNGVFKDGTALRAKDIIRIEPDWHKVRGWNRGWKMQLEDYEDIRHLERGYQDTQSKAKEIAEYLMKNNPDNSGELLSKPMDELVEMMGIGDPDRKNLPDDLSDGINRIANNFKI